MLATPGAAELVERLVQEALRQLQIVQDATGCDLHAAGSSAGVHAYAHSTGAPAARPQTVTAAAAAADGAPSLLVRVGVGCDRGLHRSVAVAEAATAQLARRAEKADSGRNRPALEGRLRGVAVLPAEHRELSRRDGAAPAAEEAGEEGEVEVVE